MQKCNNNVQVVVCQQKECRALSINSCLITNWISTGTMTSPHPYMMYKHLGFLIWAWYRRPSFFVSWSYNRIWCGEEQHFYCTCMKHFMVVEFHNTKCCMHVIQNMQCYTERSPTVETMFRKTLCAHMELKRLPHDAFLRWVHVYLVTCSHISPASRIPWSSDNQLTRLLAKVHTST